MDELVERFKAEARGAFRAHPLGWPIDDTLGDDRFEAIREEAHKLKGAAGMLGFRRIQGSRRRA